MLEKTYQPSEIEGRIYKSWEDEGCFAAGAGATGENAETFSIVIPPPNVTGSLHMGHALNNTLQDILVRFERMRGKDVLWQPGTDHAGIATQMVVERQLAESQQPDRHALGRDAFITKIWEWKAESGDTITNQLKRLGASCDWSRDRFTMDEGLSDAVLKTFVQLYNDGLIYKDKRLVNWDPEFRTAISDLEVENIEVDGHMWHFKYPLADGETYEYVEKDADGNETLRETRDYISIATTRPETMLGDGAVAVHPSDERYAPIVGKLCEIPVGPKEHRRFIPIITDDYPDPEFGSGAVKITGAHDFNDYEVARRGNIPMYRLMDEVADMRDDGVPYAEASKLAMELVEAGGEPDRTYVDTINLVPDEYRGLDRFTARKRVVADCDAEGLMIKVEDKKVMQPFGDRSRVVIEPMLTDQWFCNAEELAKPAISAVENDDTKFFPKNWEKTYFEWMRNIQPWCISRQLWWGHQIPAWYGPDGEIFVAESEADARAAAEETHGAGVELTRDPDVLDTWFSSALWPFSTLGWPEQTPELARYYPTSVLITGFDIIFFWVARMMMFGLHTMKDETGAPQIPFNDVYIHALVRDEDGKKMSKSEGNVIDPVDLIQGIGIDDLVAKRTTGLRKPEIAPTVAKETRKRYPDGFDAYGADALRFTLAVMAAMGRDIKLSVDRVAGYRNFGTKLWNASRFAQMNECATSEDFDPASAHHVINRWIIGATAETAGEVTRALEAYRYNDAADAIYRFTWHTYCDWYVELIKPLLNGSDEDAKVETRKTAAWALDHVLKLLHPFMPFITEELWDKLAEHGRDRPRRLMLSSWPALEGLSSDDASAEVDWVIALVTEIRSVRSEMNVPAGTKIPLELIDPSREVMRRIDRHTDTIERLARLDEMTPVDEPSKGAAQIVVGETTMALPLAGVMDVDTEAERLRKEITKHQSEIAKIGKKLSNAQFLEKAPDHVVAEQKSRQTDAEALVAKLEEALARIESMA